MRSLIRSARQRSLASFAAFPQRWEEKESAALTFALMTWHGEGSVTRSVFCEFASKGYFTLAANTFTCGAIFDALTGSPEGAAAEKKMEFAQWEKVSFCTNISSCYCMTEDFTCFNEIINGYYCLHNGRSMSTH